MTRYLTLKEAREVYKVSYDKLEELIGKGKIKTAELGMDGQIIVRRDDIAAIAANWLVDRAAFTHLEGQKINVSEASMRYKIQTGTISSWADMGMIKTLGYEGRTRWLNEADVAYLKKVIEVAYGGDIPRGRGKQIVRDDPL